MKWVHVSCSDRRQKHSDVMNREDGVTADADLICLSVSTRGSAVRLLGVTEAASGLQDEAEAR